MRIAFIALIAFATFLGVTTGHAEKRVALVVGNDHYANLSEREQLQKAVNDARAVGKALAQIGFDVIPGEDLGRQALIDKLDELTRRLSPGDTVFFFFSGHGVTLEGANYILPADVPNVTTGQDTRLKGAALAEYDITSELVRRGARVAVVVLDACRTNPFARPGTKGVGNENGLVPREPPSGVFSLYAAGSGETALDRIYDGDRNPNSVFTRALVPALTRPGLDLPGLAVRVREEVAQLARSAKHDERPAYYDGTIGGQIYLAGLPIVNDVRPNPGPAADVAAQDWKSVETSTSVPALEAFKRRHPGSFQEELADLRIAELRKLAAIAPPPPAPAPPVVLPQAAPDEEESTRRHRANAAKGDANAQFNLAYLYDFGRGGLTNDEREAARLYKLAADKGNAGAQQSLGKFYEEGRGGLTKDDREAVHLYKLAADQGYANGQVALGVFYRDGRGGLAKDEREAARLFKLTADQGNAYGQAALKRLAR